MQRIREHLYGIARNGNQHIHMNFNLSQSTKSLDLDVNLHSTHRSSEGVCIFTMFLLSFCPFIWIFSDIFFINIFAMYVYMIYQFVPHYSLCFELIVNDIVFLFSISTYELDKWLIFVHNNCFLHVRFQRGKGSKKEMPS